MTGEEEREQGHLTGWYERLVTPTGSRLVKVCGPNKPCEEAWVNTYPLAVRVRTAVGTIEWRV